MKVDIGQGVKLFFDVVGPSLEATDEAMVEKPTLLLLHGGPGVDHSTLRPYFDRFADTHQVVYFDHRGHGRSDGREDPSGWNLDTWADDIVRFCDELSIEHPAVLGNSFGGMVAMHYAARHPHHPSRLVISSSQARPHVNDSAAQFEVLGGVEARASYERRFVHDDLSDEAWADYRRINLPLYTTKGPSGMDRSLRNLPVIDHWQATKAALNLDLVDGLRQIAAPTLVLGGAEDPMTPAICHHEIFDHLDPDIRQIALIADCGHGPWRDQPEETETILRAFLAE